MILTVASQKVFPSKIDVVTWYCRVHEMTKHEMVSALKMADVVCAQNFLRRKGNEADFASDCILR
jgi:hypothetical protein